MSVLALGSITASLAHAECDSGFFVVDGPECMPVPMGETLTAIVNVDNQSEKVSAIRSSSLERIVVQVLSNELRAPSSGRWVSRLDIDIASRAVDELTSFAWSPSPSERLTTALVQCSVRDVQIPELPTAAASITCQMTAGKMRIESDWMTGYQIRNTRPMSALLTGQNDVDHQILTTLIRQIFAKMIDASRTPH